MQPAARRSSRAAASASPSTTSKRKAVAVVPSNEDAESVALQVHRCRFVDWMPAAVHALCFSPNGDRLAVARANGDVEVLARHGDRQWHLLFVVAGAASRPISAMKWSAVHGGRLFVASLDGTLWEIDLEQRAAIRVVDANGGPIWCMDVNEKTKLLAVGCEDGRIRVFSFEEDDAVVFRKAFVSTRGRVVSLAWHSESQTVFSGSDDGVIFRWNATTGRNDARITLETETLARQQCIVWALHVLSDMTVVSGDAHGHVCLWDGRTGTLRQQFTHLTADVLALCGDAKDTTLYAAGVDNQVVEYRRVEATGKWGYSYTHRAHTHDVRALALSAGEESILVSAGIDTQLVAYQADKFRSQRPIKMASMPYRNTFSISSEQRVLLVQKTTSLDLWRLAPATSTSTTEAKHHELLLEMKLRDENNLCCSALAPNGAYLACSTAQELRVFALDATNGFAPRKRALPGTLNKEAARVLAFSPDSTRLIIASGTHKLRVLDLSKMTILKTFEIAADSTEESAPSTIPIVSLCVSMDGQWLGVGDAINNISVFNLDSMQFYCRLPRPSSQLTSMRFDPTGKLLVVTINSNSFVCYDIEKKGLSDWYRRNHEHFPSAIIDGRNVKGIAFDPAHPECLYLYSQSTLCRFDMSKDINDPGRPAKSSNKRSRRHMSNGTESDGKQAAEEDTPVSNGAFRVVTRYRPLSFADFLAPHELVLVETPWLKVLSRLPGALQRHKYGK